MARRHRRRARAKHGPGFVARHASRLLEFIGPQQWAFMGRIAADIQAFEYEVLGNSEPSILLILIGGSVSGQLWDRRGSEARWDDLDVDAVLDRFCDAPPELQAEFHTTVLGLVTWLSNNGHLEASRAGAMLACLSLREPPEVTQLRRTVAEWPGAEHARYEQRRLERLVRMRERKGSAN